MKDKVEVRSEMELFLTMLVNTMKTCNILMGWDVKANKLVLLEKDTNLITRVDLEEINKEVLRNE